MTDTQTADVVTFAFKGTGIRYYICGAFDYQVNLLLVSSVAK